MTLLTIASGDAALIATTLRLLNLEAAGAARLAAALGVAAPVHWPPEFNGEAYRDWQRDLLAQHPGEPGFAGWYVIGGSELVGTAGFKGPPDVAGRVEIGYSIIAPRQRRGFASGAVDLLLTHAFADPRVSLVLAETLPAGLASQAVLRRCGFTPAGTRVDDEDGEVLRFARQR